MSGEGPQLEAFRRGLRDLGYNEGKNIVLEYRDPEGKNERLPGLVAELVQLKVDVLVLTALPAILAAKQATKIMFCSPCAGKRIGNNLTRYMGTTPTKNSLDCVYPKAIYSPAWGFGWVIC